RPRGNWWRPIPRPQEGTGIFSSLNFRLSAGPCRERKPRRIRSRYRTGGGVILMDAKRCRKKFIEVHAPSLFQKLIALGQTVFLTERSPRFFSGNINNSWFSGVSWR